MIAIFFATCSKFHLEIDNPFLNFFLYLLPSCRNPLHIMIFRRRGEETVRNYNFMNSKSIPRGSFFREKLTGVEEGRFVFFNDRQQLARNADRDRIALLINEKRFYSLAKIL